MLTSFDELTCHQTVSTFDHPETSDRAWTEKLWCNIHDCRGEMVLATGFGIYPNRNVIDGYGCVNIRNREQFNMRISRVLRPRIDQIALGPLAKASPIPLEAPVMTAVRRSTLRPLDFLMWQILFLFLMVLNSSNFVKYNNSGSGGFISSTSHAKIA